MTRKTQTLQRIYLLTLTVILVALIFAIAYSGKGPVCFAFLKYIPGGDKTGHVVLLSMLTISASWILSLRGIRIHRITVYHGALVVSLLITAEEFVQILSPYRTFDLSDLACNYIGILIGWAGLSLYENRTRRNSCKLSD